MAMKGKTPKQLDRDCRRGLKKAIEALEIIVANKSLQLTNASISINNYGQDSLAREMALHEYSGSGSLVIQADFSRKPKRRRQ